ncbi:AraC family transcriptional regulator [Orenia metallireducens]|uniref:Transcriptional regulator, AraC family n=1 Tax=Orenia metallireducens TaxID=1413210 RepID=A0A285HWM3_9FIRM|nr:helix-turn-helix transcriptional regulator [Orenia metallireducens]PRX29348.1 AraC family transcriptional regulator [Orenia metallireducens]SNY40047.1 transcriptional regulator, AraC family [Orenia metallireducens]
MENHFHYESQNKYNIAQSKSMTLPKFQLHVHDCYELYYFISGDVTYYIEGQSYEIKNNDILIINNQELHKPVFNSDLTYERMTIHFNPEYISKYNNDNFNLLQCFEERKPGHLNKIDHYNIYAYKIDHYFDKIIDYIRRKPPEAEVMIETTFIQILVLLNKIYSQTDNLHIKSVDCDPKITRILNFINNNLNRKITLKILQNKFHLDKYYICHLFKENTGFTILQYIRYKKIMKSKEMLLQGITCNEVSISLGFGDYSSFYRSFKDILGISPREFIKINS